MRFLEFDLDKLIESMMDHNVWANDVVISVQSPFTINIHAVRRATGMSYREIKSFLDSKGLSYSGNRITYDALPELKEWYLKKMRRYVRNALVHGLEPGSEEEFLFLEFCNNYHKLGHQDVKSWDDIDEFRLLQDFEAKCLDTNHLFDYDYWRDSSLLGRIHRSFLFHLRLRKAPKYKSVLPNTYISFILCNRYHIFTGEADSNAVISDEKAAAPCQLRINLPRRTAPYVLAS
jgi:hypothetical protein